MPDEPSSKIAKLDQRAAQLEKQRAAINAAADVTKINDFIISMCEDPSKAAAFRSDPAGAVASLQVSDELRQLLVAGGQYALRQAAQGGSPVVRSEGTVVVVVVVVIV